VSGRLKAKVAGRTRELSTLIHNMQAIGHQGATAVRMVRGKSLAENEQARGVAIARLFYAPVGKHLLPSSGFAGVTI
jgi:stage V sporulation protein SpoVS